MPERPDTSMELRKNMNTRQTVWSVILIASLFVLSGCGPASGPTAGPAATALPSPLPPTAPAPSPSPVPVADTATALPTPPPPTEPPTEPSPEATEQAPNTSTPLPPAAGTGNADVLYVRAVKTGDGTWTFRVTVQHPDTGWEDYADGWDVLTPDGEVLKPDPDSPFTRLLLHPHVGEQPFERSQSGIVIPSGITQVRVRAHDLVDGYGGREILVDLTMQKGEDYEVESAP